MDKCREAFEKLPEIENSLSENIVFIGNKYTTANDGFYDLVNWLNGGWWAWQSRQAELDEKDKRIEELESRLNAADILMDQAANDGTECVEIGVLFKALRGERE